MSLSPFSKKADTNTANPAADGKTSAPDAPAVSTEEEGGQSGAQASSQPGTQGTSQKGAKPSKSPVKKSMRGARNVSGIDAKIAHELELAHTAIQTVRDAFDQIKNLSGTDGVRPSALRKITDGLAASYETIIGLAALRSDVEIKQKQDRTQGLLAGLLTDPSLLSEDLIAQLESMKNNKADAATILKTLAEGLASSSGSSGKP